MTRKALQSAARVRPRRGSGSRRRPASLDVPLETRRAVLPTPQVDPDAFGRFAEAFARFMGTARFLIYLTAFLVLWVAFNLIGVFGLRWDPYPFILLNLFFSAQASYAAPLILLAQNRQADRDRVVAEQDRARDERSLADTEYLAREVAALRIALRDVATRDFLRSELRDLFEGLVEQRDGEPREAVGGRTGKSGGRSGSRPSGTDRQHKAGPAPRAGRPASSPGRLQPPP